MAGVDSTAIGLDRGATYAPVGVWEHGLVERKATGQGNGGTASPVSVTRTELLVGDATNNQGAANPGNATSAVHLNYKNRLQEHLQKSALPLPMYQTVNEGHQHAPQFRSTVVVEGTTFVSPRTFFHRKEAEQDVARVALEGISMKIKLEGVPLIKNDTTFCKAILHEYAIKMKIEKPVYSTALSIGQIPLFATSVEFNGETFKGSGGRSKREAEQIAARVVIESILGSLDSGTVMSQIIKSKDKLYALLHKGSNSSLQQDKEDSEEIQVQEKMFSKAILHQHAKNMKIDKPIYTTAEIKGMPTPSFATSVEFNGNTFQGGEARNKKEAEQIAAKVALDSVLGNAGIVIPQEINTNAGLNAAIPHAVEGPVVGKQMQPADTAAIDPIPPDVKLSKEDLIHESSGSTRSSIYHSAAPQDVPLAEPTDEFKCMVENNAQKRLQKDVKEDSRKKARSHGKSPAALA